MDEEEQKYYAVQEIREIRDLYDEAQSRLSGFVSDHDARDLGSQKTRDLGSAEAELVSCLEDVNKFLDACGGPVGQEPW